MRTTDKILWILVAVLAVAAVIVYNQTYSPSCCLPPIVDPTVRKDYNDTITIPEISEVIPGTPFTAYLGKTYQIKGTNDQFVLTGFLYTGPSCPVGAIYGQESRMPLCIPGEQEVYYKIVTPEKIYEQNAYRSDSSVMNKETHYIGVFLTNNNTDYKNFALMTIETNESLQMH